MATEHGTEASGGLSRRQLLTRGAVAGGLVWAAPIIRTTAAYATTANGTERPCINFFMVVVNPAGHTRPAPGNLNSKDIPPAIRQWFTDNPKVPVQYPAAPPLLTAANADVWAVLLPEVTGPNAAGRQCRMVIGWGAKGHDFAEGYVDPNPPLAIEVGRRLLFPCPDKHGGGETDGDGDNDNDHNGGGGETDSDGDNGGTGSGGGLDGDGDTDGDHLNGSGKSDGGSDSSSEDAVGGSRVSADGAMSSTGFASDGSSSSGIATDGKAGSLSSDGGASKDQSHGSGSCLDAVYLIFCCPR